MTGILFAIRPPQKGDVYAIVSLSVAEEIAVAVVLTDLPAWVSGETDTLPARHRDDDERVTHYQFVRRSGGVVLLHRDGALLGRLTETFPAGFVESMAAISEFFKSPPPPQGFSALRAELENALIDAETALLDKQTDAASQAVAKARQAVTRLP